MALVIGTWPMLKWSRLFADERPTSRPLNRFCLAWLMVMSGNLAYAHSWLEIPPPLHPLVWILLLQMGLGIAYFLGRQVMSGMHTPLAAEDSGHEN